MPFDVFVSHASKDRVVANAVCARLESAGIRCWIAPRDIVAGTSYGEAIIEAIHAAKVMVLVFSSNANSSGQVPKEVERAVSNGVAILPFRIEDVMPGKSLDYFIGSVHWLDAMTPPLEKHLDDLTDTVRKLLPLPGQTALPAAAPTRMATAIPPSAVPPAPAGGNGRAALPKPLLIGAAALLGLAAIILGVVLLRPKPPVPAPAPVAEDSTPAAVNPSAPAVNPSPAQARAVRNPGPASVASGVDPIVGCYHWFNNGSVVIHSNGIINGGPFTGQWRLVNAAQRTYTFTWPAAVDTVTISSSQRSLSGMNQYGYPIVGTRMTGGVGLAGSWNISNNVPMLVYPNGGFSYANFTGTWRAVDTSRGIYTLTWPDPVDSVTLSADGQGIAGANQYGIATSGTRTAPCTAD